MKRVVWEASGLLIVQIVRGCVVIKELQRRGVPFEQVEEVSEELFAEMLEAH